MASESKLSFSELRELSNSLRDATVRLHDIDAVHFPSWDFGCAGHEQQRRYHNIRDAALAIVSNAHTENSITVSGEMLAELVHYIADMLEN